MSLGPTRRGVIAAGLLAGGGGRAQGSAIRTVALDWGLGATLIALGAPPVGLAEPAAYRDWVVSPAVPAGTLDIGLRMEPNLELLAEIRPDFILMGPLSEAVRPILERIAPVLQYAFFTSDRQPLLHIAASTRDLGRRIGRADAAEALLAGLDADLAAARELLAGRRRPLIVLGFIDPRHVRIYGAGSLFDAVLQRAGLVNAWEGATDIWGQSTVGLESLTQKPEADILVIEPTPASTERSLALPSLWASLPQIRAGRVARLPAAWPFGDAVAARRFAGLLVAHLASAPA